MPWVFKVLKVVQGLEELKEPKDLQVLKVRRVSLDQAHHKVLKVREDHKETLGHKVPKGAEAALEVREPQEDKDSKGHKVLEAQVFQGLREHKEALHQDLQELLVPKVLEVPKVLKAQKDRQVLKDPLVHLTLDLKKILNQLNLHFQKSSTLEG